MRNLAMPSRTISMAAIIWLAVKSAIAIPIGVCLVAGVAVGEEYKLSDKHDVYVDYAAEQQLGEQTFKELMAFFHGEGKAIET